MLFPALSFLCLDFLSFQETESRRINDQVILGLCNSNEALNFQSASFPVRGGPSASVLAGRRVYFLLCTDGTLRIDVTLSGLSDDVLRGFCCFFFFLRPRP